MPRSFFRKLDYNKLALSLFCLVLLLYMFRKHLRFIAPPWPEPKFMSPRSIPSNAFPSGASHIHVDILQRPFIIPNPELCSGSEKINHVVVVHSSADHFEKRETLRKTWANPNVFKKHNSRTVFILGKPSSSKTQENLLRESEKYGDIVQGDFVEHYNNLTLKALTGFRWITEHCSNSQSVIKVDDDVFVDIFRVVYDYLPITRLYPSRLICWAEMSGTLIRHDDPFYYQKWVIPEDFFPGKDRYPMPFCFGISVFLSTNLVQQLLRQSFSTPFYFLDDVYVYGILANNVPGIMWQNEEEWMCRSPVLTKLVFRFYSAEKQYVVGTCGGFEEMKLLWDTTRDRYSSVEH